MALSQCWIRVYGVFGWSCCSIVARSSTLVIFAGKLSSTLVISIENVWIFGSICGTISLGLMASRMCLSINRDPQANMPSNLCFTLIQLASKTPLRKRESTDTS